MSNEGEKKNINLYPSSLPLNNKRPSKKKTKAWTFFPLNNK